MIADMIFLDVCLPDASGIELCTELRASDGHVHTPILMITGTDDNEAIRQAYAAGATDFMPKPLNWQLLFQRVRYMWRTHQVLLRSRQSEKLILFGAEGFVTPETFRYPANTAQIFIAQLKSAYQDTNGINITIDGNLTRYMTSPVSFSLPSTTVDTTVNVSFPTIVKAIQVQGGASCTPTRFKFPMSDAQYFIATRPNEYSFITIQINPGAGSTGAMQRFDINSKPFTLANTTEAMTVVVGTEYKPSRHGIIEDWYNPWPQYPSYGYPSLVWYYPVVGTQTLQVEAPVAYVPGSGNESDPMRYGVMDVAWYFDGQLVANHSGVSFSTLEIGNTTESTTIRAVVSNIRDTGSTGGGGSSSGGGYTPWEGVISQNGVLRDSPTNGNFIGSLWYHDKVRVIGEAAGAAVGGNSKWYNVTVLEAIPELVGVTGWVWSGNVGQS